MYYCHSHDVNKPSRFLIYTAAVSIASAKYYIRTMVKVYICHPCKNSLGIDMDILEIIRLRTGVMNMDSYSHNQALYIGAFCREGKYTFLPVFNVAVFPYAVVSGHF